MDRLATARRLFLIHVERRAIRIGAHSGLETWLQVVSLSPVESRVDIFQLIYRRAWTGRTPCRSVDFFTALSPVRRHSLHYTEHCTSYSRRVRLSVARC